MAAHDKSAAGYQISKKTISVSFGLPRPDQLWVELGDKRTIYGSSYVPGLAEATGCDIKWAERSF
ncbi:MAG: hypothetical protein HQK62_15025 [Desulfamplus sp.]|nr:hypothetical protein [Desulfamplus sp.]